MVQQVRPCHRYKRIMRVSKHHTEVTVENPDLLNHAL